MSKNRPKPAAALYFSGALSATPIGVHQKCRSANTNQGRAQQDSEAERQCVSFPFLYPSLLGETYTIKTKQSR